MYVCMYRRVKFPNINDTWNSPFPSVFLFSLDGTLGVERSQFNTIYHDISQWNVYNYMLQLEWRGGSYSLYV